MESDTSKFDIPYTDEEFDAIDVPRTDEEFSRVIATAKKYIKEGRFNKRKSD